MKSIFKKGFTLIELLIVMAILGVLAVVVLVAINPVQQLARTRDTGRISSVTQVSRALLAFYTSHGGKYLYGSVAAGSNCNTDGSLPLTNADDWLTCLRNSGELSTPPGLIAYSIGGVCEIAPSGVNTSEQNGLCYTINAQGDRVVVYARLESNSQATKCQDPANRPIPFFVWSSTENRTGLVCTDAVTSPPGPGTQTWDD